MPKEVERTSESESPAASDSASVKKSAATQHLLPPIIPQQALAGRDTTCAGINLAPAVVAAGRDKFNASTNPRDGLGLLSAAATARLPHTYISTGTELQRQVQMRQQMLLLQMQEQQRLRQRLMQQDLVLQMQEQQHLRLRLAEQDLVLQMQEQHAQEMLHQQQGLLIAEQWRREMQEQHAQEMLHQQQRLLIAEQRRREGMELLPLALHAGGGYSASGSFAAYSPYTGASASSAHLAMTRTPAYTEAPFLAATCVPMPTLVSPVSPERAAVAVAVPEQVAHDVGGREKKRKIHNMDTCSAETVTAAEKKKPKATSKRDLPLGLQKLKSGKFQAKIYWEGKERHIGTFITVEQASAAYMSARKDLEDAKSSRLSADEMIARFDAAQKKAVEAVGGDMPRRQRPRGVSNILTGVRKTPSGEFEAIIRWGDKHWYIGIFDNPEQASAAYMSVERDLVHVQLPPSKTENAARAAFDAAKEKALATVQEMIESGEYGGMF